MAPHSSTLAWQVPWTEEPGGPQSMGSRGVGHDWATSLHFSLSCIGEGNGNPLQCSCLENPRDGGAWWAAVSHRVGHDWSDLAAAAAGGWEKGIVSMDWGSCVWLSGRHWTWASFRREKIVYFRPESSFQRDFLLVTGTISRHARDRRSSKTGI